MPLFTLKCTECQNEQQKLLPVSVLTRTFECKICKKMSSEIQLPQGISSTTFVTKDPHRGVQQPKDLQQQLKKRMRDHHDKYEIDEKIDQHGIDEAKRHGWIKKRKL